MNQYTIDLLKFDKKIERYVEDFATFSVREKKETVEEIHDMVVACSCDFQNQREKVLDELVDGLQEFPFSQNQKIHDLTRCVLCGKHFKSSELGLRVAAGWIHNNSDKCKQETREELRGEQ